MLWLQRSGKAKDHTDVTAEGNGSANDLETKYNGQNSTNVLLSRSDLGAMVTIKPTWQYFKINRLSKPAAKAD